MIALAALPAPPPRPSSGAASGPAGVFWGHMAAGLMPHRNANSPWRLSEEDYAAPSFPTFAFGVGYLLDRPLALYVAAHAENLKPRLLPLEVRPQTEGVDNVLNSCADMARLVPLPCVRVLTCALRTCALIASSRTCRQVYGWKPQRPKGTTSPTLTPAA